jgi:hypothetical protein
LPITFGEKSSFIFSNIFKKDQDSSFGVGVGFLPYLGIGFAF